MALGATEVDRHTHVPSDRVSCQRDGPAALDLLFSCSKKNLRVTSVRGMAYEAVGGDHDPFGHQTPFLIGRGGSPSLPYLRNSKAPNEGLVQ